MLLFRESWGEEKKDGARCNFLPTSQTYENANFSNQSPNFRVACAGVIMV
jgi:hypothetical protein